MTDQKPKEVEKYIPSWKPHGEHYQEALVYLKKGQQGKNQTLRTPWLKIDDAGIKGWEFHSINIIGSRPGGGKTLSKDMIVRHAFAPANADLDMRVLDFSLEMVGRNSKIREFSAVTKRSYKYLCSAEQEGIILSDEIFNICRAHAAKAAGFPIDIVDRQMTVRQFRREVIEYMKAYSKTEKRVNKQNKEVDVVIYRNTLVTIDHSVLFKKAQGQSTMDMLNELGEVCTELKKAYPIIFVILSQLNRSITNPTRCEPNKYGNYPNDEDIFGADALLQHADFLMIWDRPALRHIDVYGPEGYIIEDDTVLAAHILKTRTGDTRMSFFRAIFEHMTIEEMPTPGVLEKPGPKVK
jgi:replicative DNA helicase